MPARIPPDHDPKHLSHCLPLGAVFFVRPSTWSKIRWCQEWMWSHELPRSGRSIGRLQLRWLWWEMLGAHQHRHYSKSTELADVNWLCCKLLTLWLLRPRKWRAEKWLQKGTALRTGGTSSGWCGTAGFGSCCAQSQRWRRERRSWSTFAHSHPASHSAPRPPLTLE